MLALLSVAAAHLDTDLSCVSQVWPPPGLGNVYHFTGGEVRAAADARGSRQNIHPRHRAPAAPVAPARV